MEPRFRYGPEANCAQRSCARLLFSHRLPALIIFAADSAAADADRKIEHPIAGLKLTQALVEKLQRFRHRVIPRFCVGLNARTLSARVIEIVRGTRVD